MYLAGIGTPENKNEARKWFNLAAEKGHAQAQFALGNIYYHGLI
ncbi:MAG: hypothetical protein LBP22_03880 [Deltaproteobacteria bacterium]|jgi:TPR repeat protein|nr:hypothetical protein [Deltaproteobacteria bacterium]